MTPRLEIWGIDGIGEVRPGDDIAALVLAAGADIRDGDVLVVTSKIVSKAQGRLVAGTRADHLDAETARVVARRDDTAIVETHHGFVMAAAGIDASNVPDGHVALLPADPDAAAATIRTSMAAAGIDVAVIISDTMGRAWRNGVIDTAIGAAGLDVVWDLRGQRDPAGHLLEATVVAIADELAS
ncbi:MAG: coenzyme F420-0:L-glutamate ligase, partial [Frankiaceae bacterium]|nr:coenzyme F420-0:L-glutamate ligase [Frankiaceae bacterium]